MLLAQFPAQFKCTKENVAYLEVLRDLFPKLPVAVELRDYSWYGKEFAEKTKQLMKTLNFSLVIVDEPQLPDTVPLDATVTNKISVCFVSMEGIKPTGMTVPVIGVKTHTLSVQ